MSNYDARRVGLQAHAWATGWAVSYMDMVGQPCGAISVAVGGHRKPGRWGDKTAW
jgi:hypothetical protein